jgi:predicted  nucleic acid-binding Zn-ribbon protein
MTESAGGSGEALDATVVIDETPDDRPAEDPTEHLRREVIRTADEVELAQRKLDRQREHLEGAQAAVDAAFEAHEQARRTYEEAGGSF